MARTPLPGEGGVVATKRKSIGLGNHRASISVTTEGGADIIAALTNLSADLGGAALVAAVQAGAEIIRDEAEARAPRSDGAGHYPAGGHGADHIIVATEDKPGEAVAKVGPEKDAWYLRFAEFGTSTQAADPWLRPAADNNAEAVKSAMADVIRKRLGRAVK